MITKNKWHVVIFWVVLLNLLVYRIYMGTTKTKTKRAFEVSEENKRDFSISNCPLKAYHL